MFFGIDLASLIQIIGYPGLFAIVMAESGLFFAVYLPGGSLLFTAGLLASQGYLNIYVLLATVIVAAVIGDSIGYWFGSWVGPSLWSRPDSRFFKKKYLEQTRVFFQKHGTRTIFFARFIPVVRTFAPILAGIAQMHYRTFFFYNALGAVVWGGGFVLGGYFLGEIVPGVEEYLEYFILGIIAVTCTPFFWHVWTSWRTDVAPTDETPKAIIFDLDDTLTESFQPPATAVLDDLAKLSCKIPVAIMSGAAFSRIKTDVLDRMQPRNRSRLFAFSDNAARAHAWEKGAWIEKYNHELDSADRRRIQNALAEAARESGVMAGGSDTSRILDRETSVAWTALPPNATREEKRAWDQSGEKRQSLLSAARAKLAEFNVLIGGKTTIDVMHTGISKEYGVLQLAKQLGGIEPREMVFIGDGFYEGGNDAVVIPTGIQTKQVSDPEETLTLIEEYISKYASKEA